MDVYVNGKRLRVDPHQSIGKGGEAEIYDLHDGHALKVFKTPNHPDYGGDPGAQAAARIRLAEHQEKLRAFPPGLPDRVVKPEFLAADRAGAVIGYGMRYLKGFEVLLRYAERTFRQGVPNGDVAALFRDLHRTVDLTHRSRVVIGDFNDLNVLVSGTSAWLIDADSFQYGRWLCPMFTAKFVDPLLCDPKAAGLVLAKPHNADSDWYAFAVMLMQCLLFVDPYGGVYRPKDPKRLVPHPARPQKRITVFHPDVRYPKPAAPYGILPDDLLHHFHNVFEKDLRTMFPLPLIETLRWTKCLGCGLEHARNACPVCAKTAPAAVKETTVIRGKVMATDIFRTKGTILRADFQGGKLLWLCHENGEFRREDGSVVMRGTIDPHLRYRLRGGDTLLAKNGQVALLSPDRPVERLGVDACGLLPVFDANERHAYWTTGGQLLRDDPLGPAYIGDVVSGQTLIWTGSDFGFGFCRAGDLNVAFVFDAERRGINDSVKLPPIRGQLVDATCVFARDRAWFLTSAREGGRTINRCAMVKADGAVEATAETEAGDGSWLSQLRGKCAAGNFLLAATDDGIVRLEPDGGRITKTAEFPDTEPFVDSDSRLFPAPNGLYVVGRQEIRLLKLN